MELFAGLGGWSFAAEPNRYAPIAIERHPDLAKLYAVNHGGTGFDENSLLRTNGTAAARMAGAYHMPS